ncbi:chorismate-binding protein [Streptomyces sp. NBC_00338]|uniref:chorismate-binding protein n=1 Tax=Streptomyces sp. NBC_00338 TaxID=2975715 RepID=UPI00225A7401|nr:chorismate-binding protein [Streptomyces sp. NBC_00338]MCX5141807.1 chorismate-binding protein [Streptomyces sp. NBC_00338]
MSRDDAMGSAEFQRLAGEYGVVPVGRVLPAGGAAAVSLHRAPAAGRPGTFLLESASPAHPGEGWSFLTPGARAVLSERDGAAVWSGTRPPGQVDGADPVTALRDFQRTVRAPALPWLPPFSGGLVGYLGYDLCVRGLGVHPAGPDPLGLPELALLWTTEVVALDHRHDRVVLIVNVLTDGCREQRATDYRRALARLDELERSVAAARDLAAADLRGPARARPGPAAVSDPGLTPRERAGFEERLRRAASRVDAGEARQVVLSHRFTRHGPVTSGGLYASMRERMPGSYLYRLDLDGLLPDGSSLALVGSGPEAVATVRAGEVRVRPVAGTRPRGATEAADRAAAAGLLADPKERAEHLMLVELAQEDLASVCRPGSVRVETLMEVERYSTLMHLRSTVTGRLADEYGPVDALLACTPAGTVSGTPRAAAARVIDELEPVRRGVYGGAVGYVDHTGNADAVIAIRAAVLRGGAVHVQAGAGVVAGSDLAAEAQEAERKAGGVLGAVAVASAGPATTPAPAVAAAGAAGAPVS